MEELSAVEAEGMPYLDFRQGVVLQTVRAERWL